MICPPCKSGDPKMCHEEQRKAKVLDYLQDRGGTPTLVDELSFSTGQVCDNQHVARSTSV